MRRHFDVLVIGAGSAGSVIASRLSKDATCQVGLVEAGHTPSDPDIADPLKWTQIQGRAYDWAYKTIPQPHTANRIHEWPRGKAVGGSSCLHAMAYVHGHPDDFAPWERAGGARWSYERLLPAFKRSEAFTAFAAASRGADGLLDVLLPDDAISPIARAYMAAGNALGAPKISDHNTGELVGTAPNSLNIRDGRRLSLADAYLTPDVLARANLTLLTGYEIEHIALDGSRATSVVAAHEGGTASTTTDRVVLCAGAVSSPLMKYQAGRSMPAWSPSPKAGRRSHHRSSDFFPTTPVNQSRPHRLGCRISRPQMRGFSAMVASAAGVTCPRSLDREPKPASDAAVGRRAGS